jgi:hypothetical protein
MQIGNVHLQIVLQLLEAILLDIAQLSHICPKLAFPIAL